MKSIYKANMIIRILFIMIFTTSILAGCKKLVEVDAPITSTSQENVYSSDATAIAAVTGMYTSMSQNNNLLASADGFTGMSFASSLSADELTLYDLSRMNLNAYYVNGLDALTNASGFWVIYYQYIFYANSAIEGLNSSAGLTPSVKQQLLGEATFIRAFCYFYLVNLFGDVPLVTTSDYKVNAVLSRSPVAKVYEQIINDLKSAQGLLSDNYLDPTLLSPTTERVRPTKWAADALLARTYLYTKNYPDAEVQADSVISNSSLFSLDSLNMTFLANSTETIWSLQPVNDFPSANTGEGNLFVLPSTGPDAANYPVYLSNTVLNSFEPNDERRLVWVDSVVADGITYYFPFKYTQGAGTSTTLEYSIIFRLSEQFLIRAEAKAQQGNVPGSQSDLNTIRTRAGLAATTANDQPSLLSAILHERQVELFTEWGHRWLDLKRTGSVDSVMSIATPLKSGGLPWQSYQQLYPVPQVEINLDANLKQNPGYN